jgi:hypothetical protein
MKLSRTLLRSQRQVSAADSCHGGLRCTLQQWRSQLLHAYSVRMPYSLQQCAGSAVLSQMAAALYLCLCTYLAGPGAKARTLNPALIKRDPTNGSCSWYTAQPGDTLAGVWKASGVKRLEQLLAANTDVSLIDGSRLAGKRVRICV